MQFSQFLWDLEALRLRGTLASLGILHIVYRDFSLLINVETFKTVSNYLCGWYGGVIHYHYSHLTHWTSRNTSICVAASHI